MVNNPKLSFKEAYGKLQDILQNLETKECDIEEMTKLYEEGLKLKQYCSNILENEKQKIITVAKKNGVALEEIGLETENSN